MVFIDSGSHSHASGPIAGGVIGGIAIILMVVGLLWYVLRQRRPDYYPERTVPAFKTASYKNYREAQPWVNPTVDARGMASMGHPAILTMYRPIPLVPRSPSVQATQGYDSSILVDLAATPSTAYVGLNPVCL